MIWAGSFLAILSIGVLRVAWRGARRSVGLNTIGWGLLLAGLVLGAMAHGAWGITVAGLSATAAALVLLVPDALVPRAPAKPGKARAAPDRGSLRLGWRVATFLLTVPLGFAASLTLAVGCYALADLIGWHRADSVMLALMLLPICWAILATLLLMKRYA
ncbi:hypothetical protein [Sphingomonas sp. PB4P5]|uniref:hypothetical protein n=1 Tax=Parasphingomonas puruogangriensis TaxID=3096155 RepID=UPI002FCAFD61